MASFFSKLFGKPPKVQSIEPRALPYTSLTEIPTGAALNERILAALKQGQGIGFGPEFVERATSPYVAQLQADLPGQMRDIQEYYSARGLGRATPVARQMGEVRAQHGRDINQLLAQAYLQNLAQQKADIGRYEAAAGQFAGQEAETRGGAAIYDINKAITQQKLARQYAEDKMGYYGRMAGTLGKAISPFLADVLAPQTLAPQTQVATAMGQPVTYGQTIQGGSPGGFNIGGMDLQSLMKLAAMLGGG